MSMSINIAETSSPLSTTSAAINTDTQVGAGLGNGLISQNDAQQLPNVGDVDILLPSDAELSPFEADFSAVVSNDSLVPMFGTDQANLEGLAPWNEQTAYANEAVEQALGSDSLHGASSEPFRAAPSTLLPDSMESEVAPPLTQLAQEYSRPTSAPVSSRADVNQLVVIDASVEDYDKAIASIGSDAEVVVLDSKASGIEQITQLLSTRSNIDSLHIISHGNSGQLQLGSETLDQTNIDEYGSQLQQWASALTESADILLYGCNVAEGTGGRAFVDQLSTYTGADIAASTDYTGYAAENGDWDFEYKQGAIQSDIVLPETFTTTYEGILNSPIRVEAETLNRSGYRIESNNNASGGKLLSLVGKGGR
ncbi:MAG: DUF4347 domain-containing protein [Cyanobacteria bacterium J06626_14]